MDVSLNATILTALKEESAVIYPPYSYNLFELYPRFGHPSKCGELYLVDNWSLSISLTTDSYLDLLMFKMGNI